MNILSLLVLSPFFGAFAVLFIPGKQEKLIKSVSGVFTCVSFVLGIILLKLFVPGDPAMQFVEDVPWIEQFGINYSLGLDGLSVLMVLLAGFLSVVAFLLSLGMRDRVKEYFFLFLITAGSFFGVFASLDVFLFFVFLQLSIVPVFLMISVWGGENRVYTSRHFVIYNFIASVFLLAAIMGIFSAEHVKDFSMLDLFEKCQGLTSTRKAAVLILMMIGFGIISGLFPFHGWADITCHQSPTPLSVLVAGVWLKVGFYGMIRLGIPLFSHGIFQVYNSVLMIFGIAAVLFGAFYCVAQKDIRRLISCSLIVYSGYFMLAFSSFNVPGINGLILNMISHSIAISCLFILTDMLYRRTGKILIEDFSGLSRTVPVYTVFWVSAVLCVIGMPGFGNFAGLFFSFLGALKAYPLLTAASLAGFIVTAGVFLRLMQEMFFLQKREQFDLISDLNMQEIFLLLPMIVLLLAFGLRPQALINIFNEVVINLTSLLKG